MKKLLIFMLVLGLTASVQAQLMPIELSVDGQYDGPGNVTEITIIPCTYVVIDVQAPAGLDWTGYVIINGAFPGANGEWGDKLGPPYTELNGGYYYANSQYPKVLAGAGDLNHAIRYEEGVPQGLPWWGFGYEVSDNQATGQNPGGTAFEFMFHCCKVGDLTISLYSTAGDYVTPDDMIIVHQIPEPMTIALLGLGGLLLRRRK